MSSQYHPTNPYNVHDCLSHSNLSDSFTAYGKCFRPNLVFSVRLHFMATKLLLGLVRAYFIIAIIIIRKKKELINFYSLGFNSSLLLVNIILLNGTVSYRRHVLESFLYNIVRISLKAKNKLDSMNPIQKKSITFSKSNIV